MYTFCSKVLSPRRQIPNQLSVFSVLNCRYSVFFGIVNTDVGVGIGISKYRISVRYFGIPTQDYHKSLACQLYTISSDVKRGQNAEAKAEGEVEDRTTRYIYRGQGQVFEAEATC